MLAHGSPHGPSLPGGFLNVEPPAWRGGGAGDHAHACMVADALAWAVEHDMPLTDALRALPFMRPCPPWKRPLQALDGNYRLHCFSIPRAQMRWGRRMLQVIGELEGGWSLGDALHNSLHRLLPEFFIVGVQRAEKEGRLATALPILAAQLRFPSSLKQQVHSHLMLALCKFTTAVLLVHFVTVVILPKLLEIYSELGDAPVWDRLESPAYVVAWVTRLLTLGVVIAIVLPHADPYAEKLLLRLPLVNRLWKRAALAELALGMAAFLRQGDDVLQAARWCRSSTRSTWVRGRLDEIIALIESGTPWAEACRQARIGSAFEQWIAVNAAEREDPASGFDLIADWQHQRINAACGWINQWSEPITSLVMAGMVGYIAYYVFACLTNCIYSLVMP